MRWLLPLSAAIALAACDSGNVPSPADNAEPRASGPEVAANEVLLRSDGLTAGREAFYFAAGQREVEGALARVLGEASGSEENSECGAGPITQTTYPGGLRANFQNGSLVGWSWGEPADNIALTGKIAIGAPRSEIEAEDGFATIEESTLGEEFSLGDRIGGFFEEDRVSMLYAGTQCFFR